MRIDLHVHSDRSDGTDTPAVVVHHAARAGLDVVALTDHDTTVGWAEARAEAERRGIDLVVGVELSCRLQGHGVHLLAYLPDAGHPPLARELARIREGRQARLPALLDRLGELGMPLEADEVAAAAPATAAPGRPHVADAMVARGYVTSRREAFDSWLADGRPAHVSKYAPEPLAAVALVRDAGGVPVLAHPRGRASRTVMTDDVVAELAAAGLAGLEVDHHDHDAETRTALRELARRLDLLVTGGSDHHGAGKAGHDLGSQTTAPEEYERLRAQARADASVHGGVA